MGNIGYTQLNEQLNIKRNIDSPKFNNHMLRSKVQTAEVDWQLKNQQTQENGPQFQIYNSNSKKARGGTSGTVGTLRTGPYNPQANEIIFNPGQIRQQPQQLLSSFSKTPEETKTGSGVPLYTLTNTGLN